MLKLFIVVSIMTRVKLVRLGHPARLLPQVLDSALDAQVIYLLKCLYMYMCVY